MERHYELLEKLDKLTALGLIKEGEYNDFAKLLKVTGPETSALSFDSFAEAATEMASALEEALRGKAFLQNIVKGYKDIIRIYKNTIDAQNGAIQAYKKAHSLKRKRVL